MNSGSSQHIPGLLVTMWDTNHFLKYINVFPSHFRCVVAVDITLHFIVHYIQHLEEQKQESSKNVMLDCAVVSKTNAKINFW